MLLVWINGFDLQSLSVGNSSSINYCHQIVLFTERGQLVTYRDFFFSEREKYKRQKAGPSLCPFYMLCHLSWFIMS